MSAKKTPKCEGVLSGAIILSEQAPMLARQHINSAAGNNSTAARDGAMPARASPRVYQATTTACVHSLRATATAAAVVMTATCGCSSCVRKTRVSFLCVCNSSNKSKSTTSVCAFLVCVVLASQCVQLCARNQLITV